MRTSPIPAWLREHLISSQFFSKRNAFRNGGRGVELVSDGKSQIAHFQQKRKIDLEETFEVRIERKRPALSLLKPRKINSSRAEIDRWSEPSLSSLRKAPQGMDRAGHGPTSSLPAIDLVCLWCTVGGQAQSRRCVQRDGERRKRERSGDDVVGWSFSRGEGQETRSEQFRRG